MSTYLVAIVVSDFSCKSGIAHPILSKNVDVSVCARSNAFDQIEYPFEVSLKLIEFFEKHFNIAYPLPKLGI
jgi:aminopeptidase N